MLPGWGELPGVEGGQGQGCWRLWECTASGCWGVVALGQGLAVMGTEFHSSDATVIRAPSPLLDRGEHLELRCSGSCG